MIKFDINTTSVFKQIEDLFIDQLSNLKGKQ